MYLFENVLLKPNIEIQVLLVPLILNIHLSMFFYKTDVIDSQHLQ